MPRSADPDGRLLKQLDTARRRKALKAAGEADRRAASKYHAKPQRVDGRWFGSEAEAHRYRELSQLQAAGVIDRLELQPSFDLVVNGVLVARYRADFRYDVIDDRGAVLRTVVEEVKGAETDMFKLKLKLAQALHRVAIVVLPSREVRAGAWHGRVP
jgi:hypothetical protein